MQKEERMRKLKWSETPEETNNFSIRLFFFLSFFSSALHFYSFFACLRHFDGLDEQFDLVWDDSLALEMP